MKKLKNMVAVIVCLSVMLTVPAHAQLTSTENGWLNNIYQDINLLEQNFKSTALAQNPIAYYAKLIDQLLQDMAAEDISFHSMFEIGGRVDNYFWDWNSLFATLAENSNTLKSTFDMSRSPFTFAEVLSNIDNQTWATQNEIYNMKVAVTDVYKLFRSNDGIYYKLFNENNSIFKSALDATFNEGTETLYNLIANLSNGFLNAFDAETHGTSKDIYSMIYEAYQDNIVPAEETDKTIYELLYDMHTELGGYEEGNYGYTLYGTLNEQLNVLKLREPIWEYELEEFNKNKPTYEFIGDNLTSGIDSETSLGMDSIMSMYELLHDVNTDLQDAGRQSDFLDEMNRTNNGGSFWFSSDTQNALDTVPNVMLFSDDTDPYNMNDYNKQWEVLSDVVH